MLYVEGRKTAGKNRKIRNENWKIRFRKERKEEKKKKS